MRGVSIMQVAALVLGMSCILSVPVLKMMTGLPPYIGMLLALGLYWVVTDLIDFGPSQRKNTMEGTSPDPSNSHAAHGTEAHGGGVIEALGKVDLTGLLFFTGVLLAVGALDCSGVLRRYAAILRQLCADNVVVLCSLLGVSSAIVDNVPLVQASIDMFEGTPTDDPLWQLVALAAGTGGSMLSVGSIAGVTLMGIEGVGFLWYLKRISAWAGLGFALSIASYQLERVLYSALMSN